MHITIRIIAALALIGAVVGTCSTEAEAALPSNCRYIDYVNMYASADEQVDLGELMSTPNRFAIRRCFEARLWIEHSSANSLEETRVLRNLVRDSDYGRRFGLPLVFCRTSYVTGYMMGVKWLFNDVPKLSPAEKARWRSFAARWAEEHDWCRLGQ